MTNDLFASHVPGKNSRTCSQIMAVRDEFKHVAHLQCTQLRAAGWMLETLKWQQKLQIAGLNGEVANNWLKKCGTCNCSKPRTPRAGSKDLKWTPGLVLGSGSHQSWHASFCCQ